MRPPSVITAGEIVPQLRPLGSFEKLGGAQDRAAIWLLKCLRRLGYYNAILPLSNIAATLVKKISSCYLPMR
jgi:hypothetical protein